MEDYLAKLLMQIDNFKPIFREYYTVGATVIRYNKKRRLVGAYGAVVTFYGVKEQYSSHDDRVDYDNMIWTGKTNTKGELRDKDGKWPVIGYHDVAVVIEYRKKITIEGFSANFEDDGVYYAPYEI